MGKKTINRQALLLMFFLAGLLFSSGAEPYQLLTEDMSFHQISPLSEESPSYTNKDLMCLARNIYYEARGEPFLGKIAVGLVTINRVEDARFPNDICAVVNQKSLSSASGKWVCQFSWVCQKTPAVATFSHAWVSSINAAKKILNNELQASHFEFVNILFFHSISVSPPRPGRARRPIRIGNHYFY
jgi:N-acetylmuramoyl-L-alanine amidase